MKNKKETIKISSRNKLEYFVFILNTPILLVIKVFWVKTFLIYGDTWLKLIGNFQHYRLWMCQTRKSGKNNLN